MSEKFLAHTPRSDDDDPMVLATQGSNSTPQVVELSYALTGKVPPATSSLRITSPTTKPASDETKGEPSDDGLHYQGTLPSDRCCGTRIASFLQSNPTYMRYWILVCATVLPFVVRLVGFAEIGNESSITSSSSVWLLIAFNGGSFLGSILFHRFLLNTSVESRPYVMMIAAAWTVVAQAIPAFVPSVLGQVSLLTLALLPLALLEALAQTYTEGRGSSTLYHGAYQSAKATAWCVGGKIMSPLVGLWVGSAQGDEATRLTNDANMWIPLILSAVVLPVALLVCWMHHYIPPPTQEEVNAKSTRTQVINQDTKLFVTHFALPLVGFCIINAISVCWLVCLVLFTGQIGGTAMVSNQTYAILVPSIMIPALIVSGLQDKLASVPRALFVAFISSSVGHVMALIVSCLFLTGNASQVAFAVVMCVSFSLIAPQFLATVENLVAFTDAQMSASLLGLICESATYAAVFVVVISLHFADINLDPTTYSGFYGIFGIATACTGIVILALVCATLWNRLSSYDDKRTVVRMVRGTGVASSSGANQADPPV